MTGSTAGSPITPPGPGLPPRYEVRSSLGKGGMGRVYLCYDSILDATVAVKVLAPQFLEDQEAIDAIRAEARHVFKFHDCSRILRLHNFDQHEGNWYLVMEYAEGGSLDARLKRETRFPEPEVRRLGAEVAEALEFAHRQKVLHRDVKPANILLDRLGGVKVGDFGIAKLMDGMSAQTQHITGTPVYMAPEQILRLPMDGRTDLYSLGCMLFEMAAGVRPYTGAQAQIFLAKVGPDASVPDLKQVAPHVSTEFAAIVRRAMALMPDDRYGSCAELAAALRVGAAEAPENATVDQGATITQSTAGDVPTAPRVAATAIHAATVPVKAAAAAVAPTQAVRREPEPKSRLPLLLGAVGILAAAGIAFALLPVMRKEEGKPPGTGDSASVKPPDAPPKPGPAPDDGGAAKGPEPKPPEPGKEPPKARPAPVPKENPTPGSGSRGEPDKSPGTPPDPKPPEPALPKMGDPAPPSTTTRPFDPVVKEPPPAAVLEAQKGVPSPLPAGFHRMPDGRIWCDRDGAEMVLVPEGEFRMGSDDGEPDEKPAHKVVLGPYLIDRHEVTVAQYRRFCEATSRSLPTELLGILGVKEDRIPVVAVPWPDADAYAKWAGKELPTEAQWEKAARGRDGAKFPWGNEDHRSWFNAKDPKPRSGDGFQAISPVGGFPKDLSPFGCLDMAGNVSEWCADWYQEKAYESHKAGTEPEGPDAGEQRVVRGGSHYLDPSAARAGARNQQYENLPKKQMRQAVGFRCVRRLP